MTGIERLRDFARHMKDFSVWPGGQKLLDIADQIEREQDKVAQMDWDAVREVAADMASRVFMSVTIDELLCDWSRKLTDAADGHDHAKDVSMSAYDLLPADDRDAIAWVRRHGGVEALRRMFQDADSRRVELCGALGIDLDKGWSEAMATMLLRLMPEGMEWPRFEDGESVRVGDSVPFGSDAVMEVTGVEINRFGYVLHGSIDDGMRECVDGDEHGVAVKRPAPKVLDVDGAEIEVGDDLYSVEGNLKFHVSHVDRINGKIATDAMFSLDKWADPSLFTHRTPVLAADGRPLREGETVWNETGLSFKVTSTNSKNNSFKAVRDLDGSKCYLNPRLFTHERPDSFQKLWDDLSYGDVSEAEFMRRAKALAGGA